MGRKATLASTREADTRRTTPTRPSAPGDPGCRCSRYVPVCATFAGMVRAFAETKPELRGEVLARVAAGETLKRVCAAPGMPAYVTVQSWRRREPAFAEALRVARLQAAARGRLAYDAAKAREIVAALAAGATIKEVLRRPGMPSWTVYAHWRQTQAELQEQVWRLDKVKLDKWRAAGRAARARGPAYDPALAERVLAHLARGRPLRAIRAADPGHPDFELPSRAVIYRWRAEQPQFDAAVRTVLAPVARWRGRRRGGPDDALAGTICKRIAGGRSLASVARDPDMPCARTLAAWLKRHPEFAAQVEDAYQDQAFWDG